LAHSVSGIAFAAPDPTTSGFAEASIWQHDDSAIIDAGGTEITVDLDSASVADPSAPGAPAPSTELVNALLDAKVAVSSIKTIYPQAGMVADLKAFVAKWL
jgi:hypothetical protein